MYAFNVLLTLSAALGFATTSVLAIPTAHTDVIVARASNADIQGALDTLKSSTDSILPQIDSLVAAGNANEESVTPFLEQLTDALTTANQTLVGLVNAGSTSVEARQSQDDIAQAIADIIIAINTSLAAIPFPGGGPLVNSLTVLLYDLLINLELLLPGVITTVVFLLKDVVGVVVALLRTLIGVLTKV